jgi:hypothetical protein
MAVEILTRGFPGDVWVSREPLPGSECSLEIWLNQDVARRCPTRWRGQVLERQIPAALFNRNLGRWVRSNDDEVKKRLPFISIAKAAADRWLWCVWDGGFRAYYCGLDPRYGYAATKAEAEEMAGGLSHFSRAAYEWRTTLTQRRAKPSESTGAQATEYVWYRTWGGSVLPARVLKKTRKRIFVDPPRGPGGWRSTISLDRAKLEAGEEVWDGHFLGADIYTLHKPETSESRPVPDAIRALGLGWPSTARDVKRAFRRMSRKLHPDVGGDHEAFIELQAKYEEALKAVASAYSEQIGA